MLLMEFLLCSWKMPEPEVSQSELFRNVDQGGEAGPSEVQPEQTEAGPSRIHESIEVAPPRENPPEPERSQMEEGEIPREMMITSPPAVLSI